MRFRDIIDSGLGPADAYTSVGLHMQPGRYPAVAVALAALLAFKSKSLQADLVGLTSLASGR